MNTWTKLRMVVVSITGVILFSLFGCEEQKYPWGRDTEESFGNGRFQILGGSTGVKPEEVLLYDNETRTIVVHFVENWTVMSEHVFLVDTNGKCWRVNYRSGVVASFEKPESADTVDRNTFEKLFK